MKLAESCVRELKKCGMSLSVAESCTGGMIADEIVGVPGASDVFYAGYVTYTNQAKMRDLSVSREILDTDGAVSAACARAMALGARKRAGTDAALSSTGFAGPLQKGSSDPVGLVFLSCCIGTKIITRKFRFSGSRYQIRRLASQQAFLLLADALAHAEDFQ